LTEGRRPIDGGGASPAQTTRPTTRARNHGGGKMELATVRASPRRCRLKRTRHTLRPPPRARRKAEGLDLLKTQQVHQQGRPLKTAMPTLARNRPTQLSRRGECRVAHPPDPAAAKAIHQRWRCRPKAEQGERLAPAHFPRHAVEPLVAALGTTRAVERTDQAPRLEGDRAGVRSANQIVARTAIRTRNPAAPARFRLRRRLPSRLVESGCWSKKRKPNVGNWWQDPLTPPGLGCGIALVESALGGRHPGRIHGFARIRPILFHLRAGDQPIAVGNQRAIRILRRRRCRSARGRPLGRRRRPPPDPTAGGWGWAGAHTRKRSPHQPHHAGVHRPTAWPCPAVPSGDPCLNEHDPARIRNAIRRPAGACGATVSAACPRSRPGRSRRLR